MDYKRILRDYALKPIVYTGLAASVFLGGCEKRTPERVTENTTYSFEGFGINDKENVRIARYGGSINAQAIATGDFDGDGDSDIAVLYRDGGIDIYENKMPQKSRN